VRWAIRTRHVHDERVPAVAAAQPDLTVVRLCTTREVDQWLRDVVEPLA
jgi:hypothetical protein